MLMFFYNNKFKNLKCSQKFAKKIFKNKGFYSKKQKELFDFNR